MNIKQPPFSKIYSAHDSPVERAQFASVVWAETIAEIQETGKITARRLFMAQRYVEMCTEYAFYYSSATFEQPVKKGPNGGDMFSMKWSAIMKINDQILKLEDALLISPKAAGIKLEARKPDSVTTPADKYLGRAQAH